MATGSGAGMKPAPVSAVNQPRTATGLVLLSMALCVEAASAQTHVLVVAGVGGDALFTERFTRWGLDAVDAARRRLAVPEANVTFLAERPERDPRISGPATKERLETALRDIGQRAGPDADVVLVLFGHGSDREGEPRFNLVGPDVTAAALGEWLGGMRARRLVVVNAASASGGFIPALAGPGRIVVTATRSGFERNATQFGEYFVQALAGGAGEGAGAAGGADTDKDGRLSVLEVFDYARREVARAYEQEKRLLTEHAQLDDDGDGKGTLEPVATGGDGALAATVFLTASQTVAAADLADPEVKRFVARRDSLERLVVELRGTRGSMQAEVYERELEELLVELALTNRALREREKRP